MNSKRKRNKIYYYIDIFFLSLPIILFLSYVIINISMLKGSVTDFDFTITSNWEQMGSRIEAYLDYLVGSFCNFLDNTFNWNGDFAENLNLILYNICHWLGYNDGGSLGWFIMSYFLYVFVYEIFSLFINIIMWLPRYFRNWIQERSDSNV